MTSNKDNLAVAVRHEQRSVSICEDRVVMWPRGEQEETGDHWDRKESIASFFNPAISFARRMSLKITGNRGIAGSKITVFITLGQGNSFVTLHHAVIHLYF